MQILDTFDELLDLRPFPVAAEKLMRAFENPDLSAQEISQIINLDPALSVSLLQAANSPVYGHGGQITSVQHATVIIGMRALKNLTMATAVGKVFEGGDPGHQQARKDLWCHSVKCASIARTLARQTGLSQPDEAFLAGIVHDVGKLYMMDSMPQAYCEIVESGDSGTTLGQEAEAFGAAHPEVGGRCGENWGLPDEINDVICFHHQPEDSDFQSDLVDVVFAANLLTRIWVAEEAGLDPEINPLEAIQIELSPEETAGLRETALTEINEAMDFFAS